MIWETAFMLICAMRYLVRVLVTVCDEHLSGAFVAQMWHEGGIAPRKFVRSQRLLCDLTRDPCDLSSVRHPFETAP